MGGSSRRRVRGSAGVRKVCRILAFAAKLDGAFEKAGLGEGGRE